ncbi:MAG: HIT domain-containing protein [Roseateles sp.]|uniref:HIT domain-containing protein n=1 Tax=Roseateles sp. TaxID=1971397 RepID=UPI0040362A34
MKRFAVLVVVLVLGILIGGMFFSRSLPRSLLAAPSCDGNCFKPADIAGLLMSAGIALAPGALPGVITESERCIGIQHWKPEGRYHVAFFPKRDVRNIMELAPEDAPYLLECLALARGHVGAAGFKNYRLVSNGPDLQHVSYFHFHVIAK